MPASPFDKLRTGGRPFYRLRINAPRKKNYEFSARLARECRPHRSRHYLRTFNFQFFSQKILHLSLKEIDFPPQEEKN